MAGKSEIQKMIDGVDTDIEGKRSDIRALLDMRKRLETNEKERKERKARKTRAKASKGSIQEQSETKSP